MPFKKMSDLSEKQFRFNKVLGSSYKRWNEEEKKFEESLTPTKGFSRKWKISITDKDGECQVEVSDDMLSRVLLDAYAKHCGIEGQIIYLKTNGKTGMEIRYYPNIMLVNDGTHQSAPENATTGIVEPQESQYNFDFGQKEEINVSDIPF
jgi:hypothetical protein